MDDDAIFKPYIYNTRMHLFLSLHCEEVIPIGVLDSVLKRDTSHDHAIALSGLLSHIVF
jgi:hypothetical protein